MEIGRLVKSGFWFKTKRDLWWVDPPAEEPIASGVKGVLYLAGELGAEDAAKGMLVVRGPGDYEAGGVEIKGFSGGREDGLETVYRVRADGLGVVWANCFSDKWNEKRIGRLGSNDVLVIGVERTTVAKCKELAKKIGVNYLVLWGDGDSQALKKFVDEFDLESLGQDKIKIDAENLPEGLEVVILNG